MTYTDLRPWNVIDVELCVGGTWWPGDLLVLRRTGDDVLGWVRWSEGPGRNRLGWFPESSWREIPTEPSET